MLKLTIGLGLAISVFAVYGQVINHHFIGWDDNYYIFENVQVRSGLSMEGIKWAFSTMHACNWHPLTWLSHMLDVTFFGLWAGGHILINVLFHTLNSILLFWLLTRLTQNLWPSFLVAAFFALHPLHVESVAWAAERKDVLSTFFWMLTIIIYSFYVKAPETRTYVGLIIAFALGLMAKPMLVTLPFVLLLLDYWPLGRFALRDQQLSDFTGKKPFPVLRRLLWEKIPLFVLVLGSVGLTLLAQNKCHAVKALIDLPLGLRVSNALTSYISYLESMLWPNDLAAYYPLLVDAVTARVNWTFLVWGSLLAGLTIVFYLFKNKYPFLLVGWLWYLGTLVPVIGVVQVANQALADRYTYIPLIGPFIMIAWGAAELLKNRSILLKATVATTIVAILAFQTYFQVGHWKDGPTLFSHTVKVTKDNATANFFLANALAEKGRLSEAAFYYKEALRISPRFSEAHNNLGNVLIDQGVPEEALKHYQAAVTYQPRDKLAQYNLGTTLARLGRLAEAIGPLEMAIKLDPSFSAAKNNLEKVRKLLNKNLSS